MLPPFNFPKWLAENADKLEPPVSNYCLYNTRDFTVMAVGGPNNRTDYHVNHTEEYFYQYKGDMLLKTVQENEFIDVPIKEGEMFMLPASIPHNPCRFADTIGIVIEIKRPKGVLDSLRWYCEICRNVVYEESFYCEDLGVQLKPVIEEYQRNPEKRTCKSCNHINKSFAI
jgi:3-hydroxyanthranilate 3,4-dioxygenase